jgi:excinuclease ABC subunit A
VGELPAQLDPEQRQIGGEVIGELRKRLQFMLNVGLHYLTLDRSAPSLSGGEGQRIRLASQLGCGLVGVLYILDERYYSGSPPTRCGINGLPIKAL